MIPDLRAKMARRKVMILAALFGLTLVNIFLSRYVIKPLKMKQEALVKSSENLKKQIAAKIEAQKPRIVFEVPDIHPIEHLQMAQGIPRDKVVFPAGDITKDKNIKDPQPNAPFPNPNQSPQLNPTGGNLYNGAPNTDVIESAPGDPFVMDPAMKHTWPGQAQGGSPQFRSLPQDVPGVDGMTHQGIDEDTQLIKANLERLRQSVVMKSPGYVSEQNVTPLPEANDRHASAALKQPVSAAQEQPASTAQEQSNPYNEVRGYEIGHNFRDANSQAKVGQLELDDHSFLKDENSILDALQSKLVAPQAAADLESISRLLRDRKADTNAQSRPLHDMLNLVQQRQKDQIRPDDVNREQIGNQFHLPDDNTKQELKLTETRNMGDSVFDEGGQPINRLTLQRMMQNIEKNNWIAKDSEEGRLLEKLQNDLESGRLEEFGQSLDALDPGIPGGPPVGMGLSKDTDL